MSSPYILVSEMLQEFHLSEGTLCHCGSLERLDDFLDGDCLSRNLIMCRAGLNCQS